MILDDIVGNRRREVGEAKKKGLATELEKLADQRIEYIDFGSMLSREKDRVKIIAEAKKASPSKGVLREDFNPVEIAQAYQKAGADAMSVLTEKKFFQGDIDYLRQIKQANVLLPVLCKDFIVDKFQIIEAAAYGADAVLLIVSVLNDRELEELSSFSRTMHLSCIIEVYTKEELERILSLESTAIQINNRNLKTFEVDLSNTEELINYVSPGHKVISASGIKNRQDILRLKEFGVDAVLVGETLMRDKDIEKVLRNLIS